MGALALTSKAAYREPFEPLPGDVTFVPYGDAAALARRRRPTETAAVVLEPIQGEAGVVVPPDGYLAAARRITTDHGALLWLDEVQTGIGRTGRWFAHQTDRRRRPTSSPLAKGLGGGIPIGACIGARRRGDLLQPGNHGTTFGGNPVACAAALAVLDTIEGDGLLDHVDRARPAAARRPGRRPAGRRGPRRGPADRARPRAGDAAEVAAAAQDAGFIVNAPTPTAIRLAPPLVLTEDDADAFLAAWPGILDTALGRHADDPPLPRATTT